MIGIKGIVMPDKCIDCPCIDTGEIEHDEDIYCKAKTYEVKTIYGTTVLYPMSIPHGGEEKGRQPWCPLVEIEEGDK